MNRVGQAADSFEPRGIPLSLARSILAFAQLTIILSSPYQTLFAIPPGVTSAAHCVGLKSVSLWCVIGDRGGTGTLGRALAIAVLLVVVAGYRPRWSCIPHCYVAFSVAVDVTVANGGDRVAEILTMLLIPACFDDRRDWTWRMPTRPLQPAWRGSTFASHVLLRCQIAIIYLTAVVSKLTFPAWRQGNALGILAVDPETGVPNMARPFVEQLVAHGWAIHLLTWSVLTVETAIALSMPFGLKIRRWGLILAILLHGAIILLMGLFSFGLIMIALVLTACTGMADRPARRNPRQDACHRGTGKEPSRERENSAVRPGARFAGGVARLVQALC